MKRTEHEVTGFRRGNGGPDGFDIAHLPHQNHIGILAERGPERSEKALCVVTDLELADEALIVPIDKLDRVFNRDDVALANLVDVREHRCQRGRYEDECEECNGCRPV